MENKNNIAKIRINIKGDTEASEMYNEIKKLLYASDLIYFDHEIELQTSSSFGFRNNIDKEIVSS